MSTYMRACNCTGACLKTGRCSGEIPPEVNLPYRYPAPHYPVGNVQFQMHPDILDRLAKIELQLELLINKHKDCEHERKENDEKRWRDVQE